MFDVAIERFASHLRHAQVAENEVVAASGEQFERLRPVLRCIDMVTIELKQTCDHVPQDRFIVHEQDAVGHLLCFPAFPCGPAAALVSSGHNGCRSENIGHPPPEALKARFCALARRRFRQYGQWYRVQFTRLTGTTRSIGRRFGVIREVSTQPAQPAVSGYKRRYTSSQRSERGRGPVRHVCQGPQIAPAARTNDMPSESWRGPCSGVPLRPQRLLSFVFSPNLAGTTGLQAEWVRIYDVWRAVLDGVIPFIRTRGFFPPKTPWRERDCPFSIALQNRRPSIAVIAPRLLDILLCLC